MLSENFTNYALFSVLIILIAYGCDQVSIQNRQELKTYYTYKSYRLSKLDTNQIFFSGDALQILKQKDSSYTFVACDTGIHKIDVINSSSGETINTKRLKLVQNPIYNPLWEHWGDSAQNGITDQEIQTFAYWNGCATNICQQEFPNFSLQAFNGDTITNATFIGKTTVINSWWFGCIPCRAEIPALNELKKVYQHDTNVQFYAFFFDSIYLHEDTLVFQTNMGSDMTETVLNDRLMPIDFEYLQIPNSRSLFIDAGLNSVPQNFIIDKNGVVKYHKIGAGLDRIQPNIQEMRTYINLIRNERI